MAREATWTNEDGLTVGFGTRSDDNEVPAVTNERGSIKTLSVLIKGTELEDTDSVTAASFHPSAPRIKRGSYIVRASLVTVVPFDSAGDAGTLDIGTYDASYKSSVTVDDADGIDVDIAQSAIDAIGEAVVCDGALVNGTVPVGATSNSDVVVIAAYQSAAFTAGEALLTIEYIEPALGSTVAA